MFDDTLKQTLNYLDDKKFAYLKEMAPSLTIDFINQDIKYLHLEESTWYERKKTDLSKSLKAYKDLIMSFKKNISNNGEIIVGYIYSIFDECHNNPIFNTEIRDQVFSKDEFFYYYFNSITSLNDLDINNRKYIPKEHSKDACLVYTKNKFKIKEYIFHMNLFFCYFI